MFIAALFTIAKLWNQPRCPTSYLKYKANRGDINQLIFYSNVRIGK
jgi:hypothetical protein